MKTRFAFLFYFFISIACFGQEKSFDLSKYKFPDYKRHQLEFNINSAGYSNKRTLVQPTERGDSNIVNSDFYANSNFDLNYQFDHLTRKRIDYVSSEFAGEYYYTKHQTGDENLTNNKPQISWALNASRRTYLKEDKLFLEGMINLDYSFIKSKNTDSYIGKTKNNQNNLTTSVGFGAGTGRMEKVSDLWQTYYILEKLKSQNSLSRELEEKDIFEVATFVSKLKNKRFFDARLQKIAELTALDSVLHKSGLLESTDIAYFTTLNDYWSYGNFPDRESGRVLKIWVSPEYNLYSKKPNESSAEFSDKTSFVSSISFTCAKQLNLYWERKLNVLISNETLIDTTGGYYNNSPANRIYSGANIGYGFYPDSRTSISGYIGYSGYNRVLLNGSSEVPNDWTNTVYFKFSAYYYISPQLQITGNLSLNYADKNYNETNPFYMQYNLGLRYAVF